MNTPQILMITLSAISLLLNAHSHGKPKEGNQSFWTALVGTIIVQGILIWGGFYK